MYVGNYGITDKINVIAMLPYVKTEASQGTMSSLEGIQDLTLAVKYNFFRKDFKKPLSHGPPPSRVRNTDALGHVLVRYNWPVQ